MLLAEVLGIRWWGESAGWLAVVALWSLAAWPWALRVLPRAGAAALAPAAGVALVAGASWALGLEWFTGRPGAAGARLLWIALGAAAVMAVLWRARGMERRVRGCAAPGLVALLGAVHVPLSGAQAWLAAALVAGAGVLLWRGRERALVARLRASAPVLALALLLVFLGHGFLLNVRSFVPMATWDPGQSGAEKLGNLMHLSSALRARSAPVGDAWMAGEPANYYIGGHFAVATIARACGMDARHAFNHGIATTMGLTLSSALGLALVALGGRSRRWRGLALPRATSWALLAAAAVALFGNMDAWMQLAQRDPGAARWAIYERVGNALAQQLPDASDDAFQEELARRLAHPASGFLSPEHLLTIDYWRSSRAYLSAPDGYPDAAAVTEFPMFSALLGDLHAHHLALPFGLLAWALVIATASAASRRSGAAPVATLAALAAAMAFVAVANMWDAIVLAPACAVALLAGRGGLVKPAARLALVGGASLVLAAPHLVFFKSPIGGESALPIALTSEALRTRPAEFLVFWGLFFVPVAAWVLALARRSRPALPWIAALLLAALLLGLGRGIGALCVVLAGASVAAALASRRWRPLLLALAVALGWLAFIEVLHFDDAMDGALARYNTVFKVMYPLWGVMAVGAVVALRGGCAWIASRVDAGNAGWLAGSAAVLAFVVAPGALALAGLEGAPMAGLLAGVAVSVPIVGAALWARHRAGEEDRARLGALAVGATRALCAAPLVIVFIVLGMHYPVAGVAERTGLLRGVPDEERALDALEWMARDERLRGDEAVIAWLAENAAPGERVLEAIGGTRDAAGGVSYAYNATGRISAATGLPAPVGWLHHEMQWRGAGSPVSEALAARVGLPGATTWTYGLRAMDDARLFYDSPLIDDAALDVLRRHDIRWIVVGSLEREQFSGLAKLDASTPAFEAHGARVIDAREHVE